VAELVIEKKAALASRNDDDSFIVTPIINLVEVYHFHNIVRYFFLIPANSR